MKNALIFIGLFFAYVAADEPDECPLKKALDQTIDDCAKSLGASEETLKLVAEERGDDEVEVQCFQACMLKNATLMENGKVKIDKMEELMKSAKKPDEEMIKEFIGNLKECRDEAEVSENDCEVIGNYNKCFVAKEEAMKVKQ